MLSVCSFMRYVALRDSHFVLTTAYTLLVLLFTIGRLQHVVVVVVDDVHNSCVWLTLVTRICALRTRATRC